MALPRVTIIEEGRSGRVRYSEGFRSIEGYWEFGGGDVVTIVSMGSREAWRGSHAWAEPRRAEILRFVAKEVVRMRAPTCTASIDPESGDILLRSGTNAPHTPAATVKALAAQAAATDFVGRYANVKAMVGLGVLVAALVVGLVWWAGRKVLSVAPANGVPLNDCVRTDRHIASFIQYTDPHLPNVTGRGGNTTTSISILLLPLDGSSPLLVPVAKGVEGNGYALARIMGSDGHTLWFDCMGLGGVRSSDRTLVTTEDLRDANPSLDPGWWEDQRGMDVLDGRLHINNADRSAALDVDPATWKASPSEPKVGPTRPERSEVPDFMVAGTLVGADRWFGLHAPEDLASTYKVGEWVRAVERGEDAERMRRLFTGTTEASSDGDHFRIKRLDALSDSGYLNAAFLREGKDLPPLRLADPDGMLMLYTSAPGQQGTLVIARVDMQGKVLWSTDTGLDRFLLQQVLPGPGAFAFVGTRPPIPDKLSEPLVVLVDHATGRKTEHSLWR